MSDKVDCAATREAIAILQQCRQHEDLPTSLFSMLGHAVEKLEYELDVYFRPYQRRPSGRS